MVSLCQVSRESRVAMGYITRCSESREDSINIYSWIYSSPGHNCKVENFSFSCVLSLTEACLPNVGMALCLSFLQLMEGIPATPSSNHSVTIHFFFR